MIGATPSIQCKYIFGLKPDTKGGVFHIDEQKIIYTAGNNVVVYNTEDKQMQFFPGMGTAFGITAITLSPLRRHLAVAERAEPKDPAIITVYDTHTQRKKRMMSTPDCGSNEYVSLEFAPGQENKYLISMGGGPDWVLIYWHWERLKVVASVQVSTGARVHQISFNALDHSAGIVATGEGLFRWYKLHEGALRPQTTDIHNRDEGLGSDYLCHAWLRDSRLAVGTDQGEVLLLDSNCEYLAFIRIELPAFAATFLLPCERGFVVGGSQGRVLVYDAMGDERRPDYRQRPRIIFTEETAAVNGLSLTWQTEEFLVITTDNAQVYAVEFNTEREDARPLSQLFHSGAITGMDVCVRKPLVATCGKDNTVRIWNYAERTLEVCAAFNEEPCSVAFHPSGFSIVVGFTDKLKMMNVFNNSIKSFKDINIRACAEVRFSHGGHLFAAASGHIIKVFNFYTGENPPHLEFKGHSGKVRSLAWSADDTSFVSAGVDGAVFEWNLNPKNGVVHPQENHHKGVNFACALLGHEVLGPEGRPVYAVGSDRTLREFIDSNEARKIDVGASLGQIALCASGKLLFAAVSEARPGALRVYKVSPLTGDHTEFQAHASAVERLRLTHDDSFLFSAGQDGCLMVWEVKDKDVRAMRREKEALALPPAEEILITKGEIEDLHQQIENQRNQNRDLAVNNKIKFDLSIQDKKDHIEKLNEQLVADAQQDKSRYDSLAESKREVEQHYEDRLRNLKEQFDLEKQELETKHQQDFMLEVGRYNELAREKDTESRSAAENLRLLEKEHQEKVRQKEQEYAQQVKEERLDVERLRQDIEKQRRKFKKIEEQLEDENRQEFHDLLRKNEHDTKVIKDESLKIKGKLTMAKRKEMNLAAECERLNDELKSKQEKKENQEAQCNHLREQINKMKKIIDAKDLEIGEKERSIYTYKQSNQVLEKFKFVLDYKIKELKQEIGPRESEIASMKEQTSKMDKKLKQLSSFNEALGGFMQELCDKLEDMQKEIKDQRTRIRNSQTTIKAIKDGIYDCAQHIQDFRKLKESILKLFNKYIKTEGKGQEPDTEKEFARQCEYLQNSIDALRANLKEVTEKHQQEDKKMMKVNAELIDEIYHLRKERKTLENVERQYQMHTQKPPPRRTAKEEELIGLIDRQKNEIKNLRARIGEIESARPPSQGRLPPIETSSWSQD